MTERVAHLWRWVLDAAEGAPPLKDLFSRFCVELNQRGLPLWRATLGLEILHPEVSGALMVWTDAGAMDVHVAPRAGILEAARYRDSPTRIVDETEAPFRRHLDQPCPDMPILEELRLQGATDYLMLPLSFIDRSRTATISFSTHAPGGFTAADMDDLRIAARLLSPYAERHVLRCIAIDLLDTYVGPRTGSRIIEGQIERGSFERIEAALWLADLRGFTRLAEAAPVEEVIAALNDWMEAMVAAIHAHDGEVLKFIGDAVLAIFPTSSERSRAAACRDALSAAESFAATRDPAEDFSLALHIGQVAYGNVGAPRRLDFTVIGPAVNRAARLQGLAKELGRRIVLSRALAAFVDRPLVDLGRHALRGVERPQRVFGLVAEGKDRDAR